MPCALHVPINIFAIILPFTEQHACACPLIFMFCLLLLLCICPCIAFVDLLCGQAGAARTLHIATFHAGRWPVNLDLMSHRRLTEGWSYQRYVLLYTFHPALSPPAFRSGLPFPLLPPLYSSSCFVRRGVAHGHHAFFCLRPLSSMLPLLALPYVICCGLLYIHGGICVPLLFSLAILRILPPLSTVDRTGKYPAIL